MAKTAAERQKAYRQRRAQEAGELRINTWVSAAALKALNALAEQQGVTQKILLEQIILAATSKPASVVQRTRSTAKDRQPAQPLDHKTAATRPAASSQAGARPADKAKPRVKTKARTKSQASKTVQAVKTARPTLKPKAPVQASLWDDF